MKRLNYLCTSVIISLIIALLSPISALEVISFDSYDVSAKSAVLMDYNTGTVLYEKNADEPLPPASVTKIMTLLLIMEAIEKGDISENDIVTVSEYASSMGGSQVFLKAGEEMPVNDLIKSIVIASANDCAVAMAEAVCGSEDAFVSKMNQRAIELGMKNTHFENVTGLDDDTSNHVTSARDIALMSRELMKHKKIFEYSTVWMDSIRNGEFGLTNTNRLIRFYKGATGLKTGSTGKAGFCISATAERNGLHLIAVIMGSENRDIRNDAAKKLLDIGFSKYSVYKENGEYKSSVKVVGGIKDSAKCCHEKCEFLIGANDKVNIEKQIEISEKVKAPIKKGDQVGKVKYTMGGDIIHECAIYSDEDIEKITYFHLFKRIFSSFILK